MSKSESMNRLPASLARSGSAEYVASRWCMLPPHVREAIVTLVDAGLKLCDEQQFSQALEGRDDAAPA